MKKFIALNVRSNKQRKFKNPKLSHIFEKILVFSKSVASVAMKVKIYLKKKKQESGSKMWQ